MKKNILLFLSTISSILSYAQHTYEVDLTTIKNDVLTVKLHLDKAPVNQEVRFSFPATVPGTYATEDFGRFVLSLNAYTTGGQKLRVKKEGINTYIIYDAKKLQDLEYTVEDIMDKKVKKNPVFNPVATNFESGKNFLFNNGGIFGYFEGEENLPININIKKPQHLFGATSLPSLSCTASLQQFRASSYHQLLDCPILFAEPDTAMFDVGKTKVTIAVYDVSGKKRAKSFYESLKRDMQAVNAFLPDLPVTHYTFLIYVDYLPEIGDALKGNLGLIKKIKLALKFKSLGMGALEHGNSSTYYLADFGPNIAIKKLSVEEQLTDAAIHEFMHILTPLGLHSQHIGNFNYTQPVMSKHLWLYEGLTEYFAQLIKYKDGVYTPSMYLSVMEGKLREGLKFPVEQMSFTEMSAHVLEKKYQQQYEQVYQRGAVLGMLLDAEIQRLSQGKKSLIDVVLALNKRYGANQSFDEDTFFNEFTAAVHPDLRTFFSTYIEGKNQWDPNKQLNYIGISYHDTLTARGMLAPLKKGENDIEFKNPGIGLERVVVKTGSAEWAGFKPGDVINMEDYTNAFGSTVEHKDGEIVPLKIKRNKADMVLKIPVKYGIKTKKNTLQWSNLSTSQ